MRQMSSDSLLTIVFVSLSKNTCTRRVHSAHRVEIVRAGNTSNSNPTGA
jgi:hypothetical protein